VSQGAVMYVPARKNLQPVSVSRPFQIDSSLLHTSVCGVSERLLQLPDRLIIEVDGCMLHYRLLSPATEASSSADGFDQMVAAWEEARERKW